MAGKTDLRWSDEEWAALGAWAARRGLRPGQAAKAIVCGVLWKGRGGGPAAPEERESSVAAAGSGGASADASGSGLGVRSGTAVAASSRPAVETVADAQRVFDATRDALRRPVGSAGSGVPVPPAGGGAASVVDPPPAADAPAVGGVSLLEAASRALLVRGVVQSEDQARALALRAIRSGQVEVFGEVCRDPKRLVDPRDLA